METIYADVIIILPHKGATVLKKSLQDQLNAHGTNVKMKKKEKKKPLLALPHAFHISMPAVYGLRTSRKARHPILAEAHSLPMPIPSNEVCMNYIQELGVETIYCDTGATPHGKVRDRKKHKSKKCSCGSS